MKTTDKVLLILFGLLIGISIILAAKVVDQAEQIRNDTMWFTEVERKIERLQEVADYTNEQCLVLLYETES